MKKIGINVIVGDYLTTSEKRGKWHSLVLKPFGGNSVVGDGYYTLLLLFYKRVRVCIMNIYGLNCIITGDQSFLQCL